MAENSGNNNANEQNGEKSLNNDQGLQEQATPSNGNATAAVMHQAVGGSSNGSNHQPNLFPASTNDSFRNYIHHTAEGSETSERLGSSESRKRMRNETAPERSVEQRVDMPLQQPATTQQQVVSGNAPIAPHPTQQVPLQQSQDAPTQPQIQPQAPQAQAQAQAPLLPVMNPALLIGYDGSGNPIHVPTSPLLYMIHFLSMMGAAGNALPANPLVGQPVQTNPAPPTVTPPDSALMPPPPPLPVSNGEAAQAPAAAPQAPAPAPQVAGTPAAVVPPQPAMGLSVANIQQIAAALLQAQQQGQVGAAGVPVNVLQQAQLLQQVAAMTGNAPATAIPPPAAAGTPPNLLSALLPNAAPATSGQQAPVVQPTLGVGVPTTVAGQNLNLPPTQQPWGFVQAPVGNIALPFGLVAPANAQLSNRPPVSLYMSCDDDHLSEYQILVRKQLELFEAQQEDVQSSARGRKKQLVLGQIGIRCKHCYNKPAHERGKGAVYYPAKLDGLYQASQNMAKSHLCDSCCSIDVSVKEKLVSLRECKTIGATRSGGKQYWADSARVLGVFETGIGLRFGSK